MTTALLYSESVESIPADESQDVARMLAVLHKQSAKQFEATGQRLRGVHVKSHGCVNGDFEIHSDLPHEYAQGLFAQPRHHSAVVRFSNGASGPRPDAAPDTRGLAIKVENVEGMRITATEPSESTQDFLMANHATFFAKDAKAYRQFMEDSLRASEHPLKFAVEVAGRSWNPRRWPWPLISSVARAMTQVPLHPAASDYFSLTPIRYGNHVAKYRVVATTPTLGSKTRAAKLFVTHKNAMRQLLHDSLAVGDLTFDFQVQLRTSESSMPVEDATVYWPERESPYRTVATLRLPPQTVPTEMAEEACENRSFNVWNALEAHRPLGGINRLRREIYSASVANRLQDRHQREAVAT